MTDFATFCPKCYAFFRDPDLFAKHVATCGTAQEKKESKAAKKNSVTDSGNEDAPPSEPAAGSGNEDAPPQNSAEEEPQEPPPVPPKRTAKNKTPNFQA